MNTTATSYSEYYRLLDARILALEAVMSEHAAVLQASEEGKAAGEYPHIPAIWTTA